MNSDHVDFLGQVVAVVSRPERVYAMASTGVACLIWQLPSSGNHPNMAGASTAS